MPLPDGFLVCAISLDLALPELEAWLLRVVLAAPDFVRIRTTALPDRALVEFARRAREALPRETLLLLTARIDLALAAGADGVQLPESALPPREIRRVAPAAVIVRSCHTVEALLEAAAEGADAASFGPVFETPSKPGTPGCGETVLAEVCRRSPIPVLALGGIDSVDRAERCRSAGARGVAGIRAFDDGSFVAKIRGGAGR